MFHPARMNSVLIGIHKAYLPPVVQTLHESGHMEIVDIRDSTNDVGSMLQRIERCPDIDKCTEYRVQIDHILDALDEIRPKTARMVHELFFPPSRVKTVVERRARAEVFRESEEALRETKVILSIRQEIISAREEMSALRTQRQAIELLKPFNIDLRSIGESALLYIVAGSIEQDEYHHFLEEMERLGTDEIALYEEPREKTHTVLVVTLSSRRESVDELLRGVIFQKLETGSHRGKPVTAIEEIDCIIRDLEARVATLLVDLGRLDEELHQKLLILREELEIEYEQMECYSKNGEMKDLVVIQGWAPEGAVDRVRSLCERASDGHIFIHCCDPGIPPEEVPIQYQNPSWLQPFEFLTTMYGRPRYDEIDPTPIIGPLFVLFFGFMLGDAVYGAVIALVGYLLYRGVGRTSASIRDMSIVLTACGASGIIWGVIQGGYIGDFLPRFLGIHPPFVLLEPLKDPIAVFQLALVIGIAQINLGLCIALYQYLKKGYYWEIVHRQISWFIIQPSAAVLLADFFGWIAVPAPLRAIALAGALVGALLIFIGKGAMGFFSLTGFLGDWLSYVRLLALALATGGIATTVNILTGMVAGVSTLMILPAVLVFIIGQTFNLAIQTLGGLVHAIRLQYIEFFGKFYIGGGREFAPFASMRIYTRLREGDG
jgi:V/A-type H+/Na+-transporting ATPase subunit I